MTQSHLWRTHPHEKQTHKWGDINFPFGLSGPYQTTPDRPPQPNSPEIVVDYIQELNQVGGREPVDDVGRAGRADDYQPVTVGRLGKSEVRRRGWFGVAGGGRREATS
jgi:hypothetical protein